MHSSYYAHAGSYWNSAGSMWAHLGWVVDKKWHLLQAGRVWALFTRAGT